MAITDSTGSKLPQPRTGKRIFAKNVRQKRILRSVDEMNPAFCDVCGYRVRSVDHLEGEHHQQAERE